MYLQTESFVEVFMPPAPIVHVDVYIMINLQAYAALCSQSQLFYGIINNFIDDEQYIYIIE